MFAKEKTISMPLSASFLPNNLSVFIENEFRKHYAVTHLNSVIISSVENQTIQYKELPCQLSASTNSCNVIIQAKWVTLGSRTVLVVCSQRGIQIYEWDGSLFLHWHAFKNQDNEELEETFALGVGVLNELLCIGTYSGSILVFSIPQDGEISFSEKIMGAHTVPITDICNNSNVLATTDTLGVICTWSNKTTSLIKNLTIESFDSPCTSLAMYNECLIAAYGSGHIRIFDIETGLIKSEITAHSKWISAIDVAPRTGLLLSVSEDTFLRIWQLGNNDEPLISHKFSECVTDSLICGGKFENEEGDHICLSSYDSSDLLRYHLLN